MDKEAGREQLRPLLNRLDSRYEFMVDVGEGWYQLIRELDQAIAVMAPDYKIQQVKEKFGGLRYYISNYGPETEDVDQLINEAEHKSYTICEACGQPGQLRKGGWMKTLCDEHADGREAADMTQWNYA